MAKQLNKYMMPCILICVVGIKLQKERLRVVCLALPV